MAKVVYESCRISFGCQMSASSFMSTAICSSFTATRLSQVLARARPMRPSGNKLAAIREADLRVCGSTSNANIVTMPGVITISVSAKSSHEPGVQGLVMPVFTNWHRVSVRAAIIVLVAIVSSMDSSEMSSPSDGFACAHACLSQMSQFSSALYS